MTNYTLSCEIDGGARSPATTRCPVKLTLTDGRTLSAEIFLLSDASRPGGVTSVEATLNYDRDFLPVDVGGRSALIGRNAIRTIEVEVGAPGTTELLELSGSLDVVTIVCDSGETPSGVLRSPAPAESMRTSDVFNRAGRFLTLTSGDVLILVAKAHVVEVSF